MKVGGSLLGLHSWPERLAELLADISTPLVVVGGGSVVEGLRQIDQVSPRPPALMHDLAIDAMSLTARIVADALGLPVVGTASGSGVLDAAAWLRATGHATRLPVGWHVTSDSIAALVATETNRGLLLAKRALPPEGDHDLERLAAAGWVDAHFPAAAATVATISWSTPAE